MNPDYLERNLLVFFILFFCFCFIFFFLRLKRNSNKKIDFSKENWEEKFKCANDREDYEEIYSRKKRVG